MPPKKKAQKEYGKMSETDHAKELHKKLDEMRLKHTHVGNESGQAGSRNIVIMMAKKKAMGVSKGFPDYCVTIEFPTYSVNAFIELKKARGLRGGMNGSHVHREQLEWCETLARVPFSYVEICHGWQEGVSFVQGIIDRNQGLTTSAGLDEWRYSARKEFFVEYGQYLSE